MNKVWRLLPVISLIIIQACKTPVHVSKTPVAVPVTSVPAVMAGVADSMISHEFKFQWFSGKAKIDITEGADNTQFTANFRIKSDSAIWISFTPALGIEAARVLITRDSIRIIDRLNKKYFSKGFDYLQNYSSLPIDFTALQDLICGNPLFIKGKNFSVSQNDTSYVLNASDQDEQNQLQLEKNFLNNSQTITIPGQGSITTNNQQYDIQYTPPFSLWRKIDLLHPHLTSISVTFIKIKLGDPQKFPFNTHDQQ